MLPKVAKSSDKRSKTSDSESKANKGDEKSINLEFNAKRKVVQTQRLKRKKSEDSYSEPNEDNQIALLSKQDYKSSKKTTAVSNTKGEVHTKVQNPDLNTKTESERESICDETVDACFGTERKKIKSQSQKKKKNVIYSDSESSEENQMAIPICKRKKLNVKEIKFKPKRRRIKSDSSKEENNLNCNFKSEDYTTNVCSELTNKKIETKANNYISKKKSNDQLNSISVCSKISKNSKSVINKSGLEIKVLQDDEDWNFKPENIKLDNISSSQSKLEKYQNHSESDSESIDIINSRNSNSESEIIDSATLNHKFCRSKSQKSIMYKQHEKLESSIEEDSSETSDFKFVEVDKKVSRSKFYKKKHQNLSNISSSSDSKNISSSSDSEIKKEEKNISIPVLKSKSNKKQKDLQSNSVEVENSNITDSDSDKIDNNVLKHKSQKLKSQNKIPFKLKHKMSIKLKSNLKQEPSQNTSNSKFKKLNENVDTQKSHTTKLYDKLKTNLNRKQKTSESDSEIIYTYKASDSDSEEKNDHTLNVNSKVSKNSKSKSEEVHQNILNDEIINTEVKKEKISMSDFIKVASSKASDFEFEETDKTILTQNSQNRMSEKEENELSKKKKKSVKVLINNPEEKQTNSELDSVKPDSTKSSESESEKVDNKNIFNCMSQKKNLKDKSKRKLKNSESDIVDVVNTENSNSESEKVKNLQCQSPRKQSKDSLDSKVKLKKEKQTFLEKFLKKNITEDKLSETSDVSDFRLELEEQEEEEECSTGEINSDEEDEKVDMNNIYAYRTSYWPTDTELEKLKSMHITLQHKAPPQHCIEKTSGTRNLSKEEKQEFDKYTTLKHGSFTDQEDRILKRNWVTFCKLYDWDVKNPKPFLHMKYKNRKFFLHRRDDRMKFVQFLANGLFDRSLYSVYQRFKVIFEPHKVNRYKPEEDNIILDFMQKNYKNNDSTTNHRDRKWADLALILRRTRASVWRRYQVLKKKELKGLQGSKKNVGATDNLSDSY